MTIIKFLALIRARGEIESCIFSIFLIVFTTAASSFNPTRVRDIFLHIMEIIRIIGRKDIWKIRRGGKSTRIFLKGYRYGRWDQI